MDISVVIANWNGREHLAKCLQSLENSRTRHSIEIIVVDNGSSDGSQQMIRDEFPRVILVENGENLGFARANNIGIEIAKGEYIALVNSDVVADPNCLDSMRAHLEKNPSIGLLGPKVFFPDGRLQITCRRFPSILGGFFAATGLHRIQPKRGWFVGEEMYYFSHDREAPVDVLNGCFWMTTRKVLDEVGVLDEDFFIYSEDVDWCRRFWLAGFRVVFFPGARAVHYHGGSSANAPVKFYVERHKARYHYWEKHYGLIERAGFLVNTLVREKSRLFMSLPLLLLPGKREKARSDVLRALECIRWVFGLSKYS